MAMGEVFISRKSCKTYQNTVKSDDFHPLSYFPKLSGRIETITSVILVIAFFADYLVFIHLSKY